MWTILPESTERDQYKHIGYCYLHGELETACKHDVFYLDNCDVPYKHDSTHYIDLKDGIYPCEYNNNPATIFLWTGGDGQKGLAVYNNDFKAFNYAKNCFTTKVACI